MESAEARGRTPLGAVPARPRAVLLDGMGTLVALEHYLAHHLEGRDADSLDRLRDECAAVLHEALGPDAAGVDRALVRRAMLDAIHFDAYADSAPALRALRAGGP